MPFQRQLHEGWFTMSAGSDQSEHEQDGWMKISCYWPSDIGFSSAVWLVSKLLKCICIVLLDFGSTTPHWARASSFTRFLDHTQRHITVGRTLLDVWSARHRDLYLFTHNTHNRETSLPPVGFEPAIPAGERPQTYALDRAATGIGCQLS